MTIASYGFKEQLVMSQGYSDTKEIAEILFEIIPGSCKVFSAHSDNDKNGTDYWIEHKSGQFLSIDCKVRQFDCVAKYKADDLALETWSVIENNKIGWTRDEKKRTDYIFWIWIDTGRWCLIPFPMLCKVFSENWQLWKNKYRTQQQKTPIRNGFYHSECVFVPRNIVWKTIYSEYAGQPA